MAPRDWASWELDRIHSGEVAGSASEAVAKRKSLMTSVTITTSEGVREQFLQDKRETGSNMITLEMGTISLALSSLAAKAKMGERVQPSKKRKPDTQRRDFFSCPGTRFQADVITRTVL